MEKLRINMLSKADSVDGQGVGSAYLEQVALVKESNDLFDVKVNAHGHFDIVHVHSVNPSFYFKMNKRNVNVCYVHFIPSTLDGSIKLPKPLFYIFKKYVIRFYKKADEIVVVNPIFAKPLIDLGIKKENITYIPNYVSKDQFHKISDQERIALREKYGIDKDKFVVLGCGQVQTRKGVVDFIKVAKENKDVSFVWAGGFSFGKMTDGYKELKEIMDNPPDNVKFIGIIPRKEMNGIFNMCDVLFMPSFSELFPMSILEAVNSEKPVMLRDIELYQDILFMKYLKGKNVDDWTKILLELKNNKEFYDKASQDSKYLADYYSKEHVSEIWREYYPRIFEKNKANKKIKPSK